MDDTMPFGTDMTANSMVQTVKKLEPKEVLEKTDKRDLEYYRLAESTGWMQLKEEIANMITSLDNDVRLENSKTMEEFGFMVVARDLVKTYLNRIIHTVDISYEHVKKLEENAG